MEMEQRFEQDGLATFIAPGFLYLLREKQNVCRFELTFRDEIDPAALQAALDAVLLRAPFFRSALVWQDKNTPALVPNDAPCVVTMDGNSRTIPEETNGYLFAITCMGCVVVCEYLHFLTDGRGITQFLTQLTQEYCNRRYGTNFAGEPLISAPLYSMEQLNAVYAANHQTDAKPHETLTTKLPQSRLYHTVKADWVAFAQRNGVKPFCVMLAALCKALRLCGAADEVIFSYAVDSRRAMNVPQALYNCVSILQGTAQVSPDASLSAFVGAVDAQVRRDMADDEKLCRVMAGITGWANEVAQMKAPFKIKQRVFQMGEAASSFHTDFWLSYLGDPFVSAADPAALRAYLQDYQVWVEPDMSNMGIEAISLNGKTIFCVQDRLASDGFDAAFRRVLQEEHIRLCKATDDLPQ
jgi:hypothetical protein